MVWGMDPGTDTPPLPPPSPGLGATFVTAAWNWLSMKWVEDHAGYPKT